MGIQSFGFGNAPKNDLGECIGNLEDLQSKFTDIVFPDHDKGLFLKLKVTKYCHCDFNCEVKAVKDGQEIEVNGISIELEKKED